MAFHFTHALLAPHSIIQPGNFGRIVRAAGYSHSFAMRESILEYVRQSQFPDLPSRLDAVFYFDTIEQARAYNQSQNLTYANWYEVAKVDDRAPEARADFRRVTPVGGIGFEWAASYWRADPWGFPDAYAPEHYVETLAVSSLRVIRRLADNELDAPPPPH